VDGPSGRVRAVSRRGGARVSADASRGVFLLGVFFSLFSPHVLGLMRCRAGSAEAGGWSLPRRSASLPGDQPTTATCSSSFPLWSLSQRIASRRGDLKKFDALPAGAQESAGKGSRESSSGSRCEGRVPPRPRRARVAGLPTHRGFSTESNVETRPLPPPPREPNRFGGGGRHLRVVEARGLEPLTRGLRVRCSAN
jgi:hypothetical protein